MYSFKFVENNYFELSQYKWRQQIIGAQQLWTITLFVASISLSIFVSLYCVGPIGAIS